MTATDIPRDLVAPDPANGIKGDTAKASTFNAIHAALRNRPTYDEMQSPVNLQGVLTDTGDLPDDGNTTGDAYLVNGTVWVWDGSAWTNQGSLTTGPQGDPAALRLKGSQPTFDDLPTSGNVVNDLWTVEADGHGYGWTMDHEWVDLGAFTGPQGPGGADTVLRSYVSPGAAPVNAGDTLQSSNGTAIAWIKPGRIDARVRGLSTADSGDDNATLLATLFDESATEGKALDIPDGTYRTGRVDLVSHLHLAGKGTIRQKATPDYRAILSMTAGDKEDIAVEGITLDGEGESALMEASAYPDTVSNLTVRRVRFLNTHTDFESDVGLTFNVLDGGVIEECYFDCEAPVRGSNADNLKFRRNWVERAGTRNAFDIQSYDNHDVVGLEFTENAGHNLYRMAIELVRASGTGRFLAPVLAVNDFEIADTFDIGFVYSLNFALGAMLNLNRGYYRGSNAPPAYGTELRECHDSQLNQNYMQGFEYAYTNHSSNRVGGSQNVAEDCYNGIELTTAYGPTFDHTWLGDRIINPRDAGIIVPGYLTESGGHEFGHTIIHRDKSFTGDSSRAFDAIQVAAQYYPSTFHSMRLVQAMAAPTLQYFVGARVFWGAGDGTNTAFHSMRFRNMKTSGSTSFLPLVSNGGPSAASDAKLGADELMNIYTLEDRTMTEPAWA